MRDVRERHTLKKSISWTESQHAEIKEMASRLGTSFAEVVRSCVARELPRMRERVRKRKNQRNTTAR